MFYLSLIGASDKAFALNKLNKDGNHYVVVASKQFSLMGWSVVRENK